MSGKYLYPGCRERSHAGHLGASLLQIYTALVYEGPGTVKRINRGLCELLARDGVRRVNEVVGTEA